MQPRHRLNLITRAYGKGEPEDAAKIAAGFLPIGGGLYRRDGSIRRRQGTPPSVTLIETSNQANQP